jgi:hypothetical protein
MSLNYSELWAPTDQTVPAGVSEEQIAAWEGRHHVTLPRSLRKALKRQNGGLVQYSEVRIHELEQIVPVERQFWRHTMHSRKKFANAGLVFHFASADDEPLFFLNFNANGPEGEPTVYHWYHDPGEVRPVSRTVRRFFADLIEVSSTPAVDWSETERLDEVLFRERINTETDYEHVEEYAGQEVYEEVVLGRFAGQLIHYTHQVDLWGEHFCRTVLPEPLSRSDAGIDQERPAPGRTYGLHLEPREGAGIVCVESSRMPNGMWKSSESHGVPVYITVESRSKDDLKALRETLFGKKAARKAAEQDDATEQMMAQFESLTPEQQRTAAAAFVGEMFGEISAEMESETEEGLTAEDQPEEIRQALQNMARLMEGMQQEAAERAQAGSGDPAILSFLEVMRRSQGDPEADDDSPGNAPSDSQDSGQR